VKSTSKDPAGKHLGGFGGKGDRGIPKMDEKKFLPEGEKTPEKGLLPKIAKEGVLQLEPNSLKQKKGKGGSPLSLKKKSRVQNPLERKGGDFPGKVKKKKERGFFLSPEGG